MTTLNLTPEQSQKLLLFIENTSFAFESQIDFAEKLNQRLDISPLKATQKEIKNLTKTIENFLKETGLSKIVIENKK
jgi:hypothetical protein